MDHIESLATTHRLTHDGTNPDCAFCKLFGPPNLLNALVRAMVREELAAIQLEEADAEHDDIMEEIAERRRRREARAAELAEEERRRLEQRIDDLERKQWQK
jgi:hypothetical protein